MGRRQSKLVFWQLSFRKGEDMKNIRHILFALFLVIFLFPFAGFGASDQPITIGVLAAQTGPLTFQGMALIRGFTLALEEVSYRVAGRTIKIVMEDEVASPAVALTKTQKLVEKDHIDLLVGPVNGASGLAMRDYIVQQKVPWIVPLASPDSLTLPPLANKYTYSLQVIPGQTNYAFAEWLYKNRGYRKMAAFGMDFPIGHDSVNAFKQGFEQSKGQIVQEIYTPLNTPDFGPYLSQLKRDIDAVYAWYAGADAIKFNSQYVDFGLKDKLPLTGFIGITEEVIMDSVKDFIKGHTVVTPFTPTLGFPETKKFVTAYRAKYNADPALPSNNAYDAANVILAAVSAVKGDLSDKDKFLTAISKIQLKSPRGPIYFDERGRIVADIYICVADIKDGKMQNNVIDTIKGVRQKLP
jgi:branched-chain amino acid transport system substrate-binding protein